MRTVKSFIMPVFAICFLHLPAMALEPVEIDGTLKSMPIGLHIEYFADSLKSITIDDLTKGPDAKSYAWVSSKKEKLSLGFVKDVFWVRFAIRNNEGHPLDIYLNQEYVSMDHCDLYVPRQKGGFDITRAGDKLPFLARPVDYRSFVFPLTLEPKSTTLFYMRFETETIMEIPLSLWSIKDFGRMKDIETIFYWMTFGIILVMFLYNLFIFLSTRDLSYIFYILTIAGFGFFTMSFRGFSFQYLWPQSMRWNEFSIPVSMILLNLSTVLFTIFFIQLRKNSKPWFRVHIVMASVCIVLILNMIIHRDYRQSLILIMLMAMISSVIGVIASAHLSLTRKNRQAMFYLGSFFLFLAGVVITVLKTGGILPVNVLTENGIQVGIVMQIVLLSLGLADRINVMRRELKELNVNLEKKVEERTEELQAANIELSSMNEQLVETRNALWGEMELAKKIQTVLLPVNPSINGYHISAYMETADEVGGDYYDVINVKGLDWIIIGDVSGHGVPAGLIMMMVQTAIRTAIEQNPRMSPSDLLAIINKIISENIKRISEDKYMTITVFATYQDGKFSFSGLHQDIMIYRGREGTIELVETDGIWLGIMEDISNINIDRSISLNPGDSMLIYTDGITESWQTGTVKDDRDPRIHMFGSQRLQDIFSKTGDRPPAEVKDAILQELDSYDPDDDITMLIIKRI